MSDRSQETPAPAFRLDPAEGGIAVLSFDLPGEKVNKLTTNVLIELEKRLVEIAADPSIRALVFIGGKEDSGTFIAGADIDEIKSVVEPTEAAAKARRGQEILDQFARLPQPVVAAVHGVCLGGGCELILACDHRIASDHPKTQIGLPEVNLGIIPGFGGTQRLPRLIGIQPALDLILGGRPVDARKAARLGLVDRIAPAPLLRRAAVDFARELVEKPGKKSRRGRRRGLVAFLLEGTAPGRKLIRRFAEKEIQRRTGGRYPAPRQALRAVLEGIRKPIDDGLRLEAELVGGLVAGEISKCLIEVFQASERLRRGRERRAPEPAAAGEAAPSPWSLPARRFGVLGAGVMGGSIAALLARKGFHVRLRDIRAEALTSGLLQARRAFDELVDRRRMSRSERDGALAAISATTGAGGFRRSECIIEAVVEDMKIKQAVIREFEPLLEPGAVFASNTSSLSIDEMAEAASRPERVAGLHFFNPVHRMPLVEIVAGQSTSEDALRKLEALAREIGKYPLRVRNGPGFLVNRLLMPYLNEAAHLLEEGYLMESIDRAAVEFGLPMGPFVLLDEIGLDVAGKVARHLHHTLGERAAPAGILTRILDEEKLLGKKGGAGFYLHRGRRRLIANQRVEKLLPRAAKPDDPDLWIRRMLYPMINEAARCLDDGIVSEAWQVDIAMVMGTGFPPFRGGPLRWADSVGLAKIAAQLKEWAGAASGERFQPAERLKQLAAEDSRFHAPRPLATAPAASGG